MSLLLPKVVGKSDFFFFLLCVCCLLGVCLLVTKKKDRSMSPKLKIAIPRHQNVVSQECSECQSPASEQQPSIQQRMALTPAGAAVAQPPVVIQQSNSSNSAATNKLISLRTRLQDESQAFHYQMEKKASQVSVDLRSLKQEFFALDQQVCSEAHRRVDDDRHLEKLAAELIHEADASFLDYLQRHMAPITDHLRLLDTKMDLLIQQTKSERDEQESLLAAIQNDHYSAVGALMKQLDQTKVMASGFETEHTFKRTQAVRKMEEKLTTDLQIRQRLSSSLQDQFVQMIQKDQGKRSTDVLVGSLMLRLEKLRADLASNTKKREAGSAAFAETMDAMVTEVNGAVKKMNLGRGLDQIRGDSRRRLQ